MHPTTSPTAPAQTACTPPALNVTAPAVAAPVVAGQGACATWKESSSYLGRIVREFRDLSAWDDSDAYFSVPSVVRLAVGHRKLQLIDLISLSMAFPH